MPRPGPLPSRDLTVTKLGMFTPSWLRWLIDFYEQVRGIDEQAEVNLLDSEVRDWAPSDEARLGLLFGPLPQAPGNGDIEVLSWLAPLSMPTPLVRFSDGEAPTGAINGVNVTFTLSQAPEPSLGLSLYQNGLFLVPGTHYTLTGNTITLNVAPIAGDNLYAAPYRY